MARNVRCLLALTLTSLVLCAGQVRAADPPEAESIRTIKLQLHPAPEPRYALQYLLETPYMEQRPSNGALLYQTAVSQMMETNSGEDAIDRDTLKQWCTSPLKALSVEEVRAAIARFEQTFRYLDSAARCERCTWEYPIREEGFHYMMPQLGEYRTLSRILSLKARLEVHDGAFDEALKTLRSGISMARDVGNGPSLIQHLVGISIAARIANEIEGLIQQTDSPNLYWALTALPRPLVNPRAAMQMESAALYAQLPELLTLDDNVLSNDQVIELWKRTARLFGSSDDDPGQWLNDARDVASAMELYPRAKADLLEQGYSANKIDAWPALYAILVYQHQQFRAVRDLSFKWSYVPYPQARVGLKQGDQAISRIWEYSNGSEFVNPFVIVMPAIYRIGFIDARLERDITILRCIEAIRMYAAEHDGTLPSSLTEITQVPVPSDPMHGRAFRYQVAGGKAILESPVPPDGGPRDGLRYEITLK